MKPTNLLVLMSDQHNKKVTGCYGNRVIDTPNIDGLAARGVKFDAAYTCSPVCVPARASFATGFYNNQIGYWDNADPYDGAVDNWHCQARGGDCARRSRVFSTPPRRSGRIPLIRSKG